MCKEEEVRIEVVVVLFRWEEAARPDVAVVFCCMLVRGVLLLYVKAMKAMKDTKCLWIDDQLSHVVFDSFYVVTLKQFLMFLLLIGLAVQRSVDHAPYHSIPDCLSVETARAESSRLRHGPVECNLRRVELSEELFQCAVC